ncbi:hypothetical protein VitviT2T_006577 [Vitis vinifera]|uniref:Uncharacterized protein n=1 Tax=Vitis vinifera TaxID=29760 RepID=A0ABY9BXJ4_VITVI|nr:hypothetical protein VitviT2T_006577 [Vitis vinifera]
MGEVLASVAETIKNFAVMYLVDITEVPDFNTMNKHIMIDLGTGNNNKITGPSRTSKSSLTLLRQFTVGRGRVVVWSLHPKTTPLSTDAKPPVVGWRFTKGHISKTCCNEHKSFELLRIL